MYKWIYDYNSNEFIDSSLMYNDEDTHTLRFTNDSYFRYKFDFSVDTCTIFTSTGISTSIGFDSSFGIAGYTFGEDLITGAIDICVIDNNGGVVTKIMETSGFSGELITYDFDRTQEWYNIDMLVSNYDIPKCPEGYYPAFIREIGGTTGRVYYFPENVSVRYEDGGMVIYVDGEPTTRVTIAGMYYTLTSKRFTTSSFNLLSSVIKIVYNFRKSNTYTPTAYVDNIRSRPFSKSDYSNLKYAIINDLFDLY